MGVILSKFLFRGYASSVGHSIVLKTDLSRFMDRHKKNLLIGIVIGRSEFNNDYLLRDLLLKGTLLLYELC